jgi:hypothetical protein
MALGLTRTEVCCVWYRKGKLFTQRAYVRKKRPLFIQRVRAAVWPVKCARQLSAKINVQTMDGQEVFGQHGRRRIYSYPLQPTA